MPSVAEGLRAHAVALVLAFALGAAAWWWLAARVDARAALGSAVVLLVAAWLGPLAANALSLPNDVGFDAIHHVAYVDFLRTQGTLPTAFDGWSMFHPPLYYGLTALGVTLGGGAAWGWKGVGLAAGITILLASAATARRLLPRDGLAATGAALLAGSLPMSATLASYVTNEALCAALVSVLVAWTTRLLLSGRWTARDAALWAGIAMAAVLTKYTAWIAVATAGAFLALAWWRIEGVTTAGVARRGAAMGVAFALGVGWFYLRAFSATGQLFPLNVDLPGETQVWWAQPGYATAAFFTRFGEVLGHPFLAGTHSAWDAFYATLWGDGQLAGQMHAAARHGAWNWSLMAAAYALALPATLCILGGAARAAHIALHDADARRRAAFSFLTTFAWLLLLSVLYMTLRQPDYGLAKAFYALSGATPLAIFFGLGLGGVREPIARHAGRAGEAALAGWLAAFLLAALGPYLG